MNDGVAAFEFTLEELEIMYAWYGSTESEYGPLSELDQEMADVIKDAIDELKPKVVWEVDFTVVNIEQFSTMVTADSEYEAQKVGLSQAVDIYPDSNEINIMKITKVDG